MYDAVVVGAGPIGSAAAKYLADQGLRTALIGQPEPSEPKTNDGIFASHYDEGRITRVLDTDLNWSLAAQRSIARYRDIERESGIPFYTTNGYLRVGPRPLKSTDHLAIVADVGTQKGATFDTLNEDALKTRFPYLKFASGSEGLHERGGAGVINPRALVRAQLHCAQRRGVEVVEDIAVRVVQTASRTTIVTRSGHSLEGSSVLLATGAFTNCFELLPQPLPLEARAETILLSEVSESEASDLASMPGIWYEFEGHATIPHVYVVPPVRYPDGKLYLKMGADYDRDTPMRTLEEMQAYFQTGGNQSRAQELQEVLVDLVPGVVRRPARAKACVLTYTPTGKPLVTAVSERLFVAVGGCGGAAKSSDEFGRLAAVMVCDGIAKALAIEQLLIALQGPALL